MSRLAAVAVKFPSSPSLLLSSLHYRASRTISTTDYPICSRCGYPPRPMLRSKSATSLTTCLFSITLSASAAMAVRKSRSRAGKKRHRRLLPLTRSRTSPSSNPATSSPPLAPLVFAPGKPPYIWDSTSSPTLLSSATSACWNSARERGTSPSSAPSISAPNTSLPPTARMKW